MGDNAKTICAQEPSKDSVIESHESYEVDTRAL